MRTDNLHRRLVDTVGAGHVLVDPDMVAGYVRDWTGRWTGETRAVVRPGSVGEVQEVMRACHDLAVPVVPQGGNTGLVGGSIPHRGEVLLSMRRLNRLGPIESRQATVGAGVTVGALQAHAREAGMAYGVDLASRDSATIGGSIATNAGGVKVVANGDTRRQVLGLEVVFADGTLGSRLDGVGKESTGPDVFQLIVGSEGTLGLITAARVRLVPQVTGTMVTLIGVGSLAEGMSYLPESGVQAAEFLDRACLEAVMRHRGLSSPLPSAFPLYVLIESSQPPKVTDDIEAVVARGLWAYRESITETVNQLGVPVKLDVAVPSGRMDEFVAAILRSEIDGDVYIWGHLAEANFHVNVVGTLDAAKVIDRVLEVVSGMDGAIASEHGIGVAKSDWWRRTTDSVTLDLSRRVKDALDPKHLLNPEVFWGMSGGSTTYETVESRQQV